MADQPRTSSHPHQIFSSLYGLNKSFTKKIIVGLEYEDFKDEYYKPVVRLLGGDFDGIAFSCDEWQEFKNSFSDIVKYFRGFGDELADQKVYGSSWQLKFTRSHHDKAIEIEEDRRVTIQGHAKRFRRSIIMKKVTFDCLDEFIVECIDVRLEYLKSIAGSVSCVASETIEYLVNKGGLMHEAQIQMYTPNIVKDIVRLVDDSAIEFITTSVQTRCKEMKNQIPLCKNSVSDVFYQFISLHMNNILDVLNYRFSDNK